MSVFDVNPRFVGKYMGARVCIGIHLWEINGSSTYLRLGTTKKKVTLGLVVWATLDLFALMMFAGIGTNHSWSIKLVSTKKESWSPDGNQDPLQV